MRLQKYIASCGAASRRKAEDMIKQGRVSVNGERASLGMEIDEKKDQVELDGKVLKPETIRYIVLNKPAGYVCTSKDRHAEKTVHDLIDSDERLYTVGRLDKDTEGLILLTNDGEFTNRLTHPSHEIEKTYEALVQGNPTRGELIRLREGVRIEEDDGERKVKTAPAKVRVIARYEKECLLEITIHEGRKRQVRKMLRAVGHPVKKLKRVKEGFLTLGDLKPGEYRNLSKAEVKKLLDFAEKKKKKPEQEENGRRPGKKVSRSEKMNQRRRPSRKRR